MKETRPRLYDNFIHPYLFVLKEGSAIKDDFLDYSLLLLQVGLADTLHSPGKAKQITANTTFQFFRR